MCFTWKTALPAALLGIVCFTGGAGMGALFNEDFTSDPLARGWHTFGNSNAFHWNSTNGHLSVTWNSAESNSYFYLPLNTVLTRQDDFRCSLDLQLLDALGGVNPAKPSTFELAFGFLNLTDAVQTNFFRANSFNSPNLVEFDFFPDTGFGATLWPSIWSTNSVLNYNGPEDYTIMDLPLGSWMRIEMSYTASNQTLVTVVSTNGTSIAAIHPVKLNPAFGDFRLTGFALESYSDAGQDPRYGGSLLAHGIVDNVTVLFPPSPLGRCSGTFNGGCWEVSFLTCTNWDYHLERSTNSGPWTIISTNLPGTGATMTLVDATRFTGQAFYRVAAQRP